MGDIDILCGRDSTKAVENVRWNIEGTTLSFTGSGDMYEYYQYDVDVPWINYYTTITDVIIEEGITDLFEDTVKPVLRDLNTFKRTGKGKTELSLERVTERRELHQKYLTNVRQFMSVIKESYPEWLNDRKNKP